MKRRVAILITAAAALAAAVFFLRPAPPPAPIEVQTSAPAPTMPLPHRPAAVAARGHVALNEDEKTFAAKLRENFAPHIGDKHAQIRLLERILAFLEAHGLARDLDHAYALLKEMFPELADALFAKLQSLIAYDDWLADHRDALTAKSRQDRRDALWAARHELFGADAEAIWAGELRSERIADTLESLESHPELTTNEKLDRYLGEIRETYGDRAPDVIEQQRTELLDRFMDLPSVQSDLASLPASERSARLREIRTAMGMDDAALQRWDTLDTQRDAEWSQGQSYMLQRDAILARYEGAEQLQQLSALQDRMFGAEAESIRSEEAAGFYRFARARRIGRE